MMMYLFFKYIHKTSHAVHNQDLITELPKITESYKHTLWQRGSDKFKVMISFLYQFTGWFFQSLKRKLLSTDGRER